MPTVTLRINGTDHTLDVPEDMPLLWALRDKLNMTGTKYSCGIGQCGTCTVLVDGEPVSMCIRTRPIRNTASVSGVYTPDNHRRKGYAGACVAGLSQKLLDEGFAYITLFTDLANPTSNSVYMRLGYEPIADFDKVVLKKF